MQATALGRGSTSSASSVSIDQAINSPRTLVADQHVCCILPGPRIPLQYTRACGARRNYQQLKSPRVSSLRNGKMLSARARVVTCLLAQAASAFSVSIRFYQCAQADCSSTCPDVVLDVGVCTPNPIAGSSGLGYYLLTYWTGDAINMTMYTDACITPLFFVPRLTVGAGQCAPWYPSGGVSAYNASAVPTPLASSGPTATSSVSMSANATPSETGTFVPSPSPTQSASPSASARIVGPFSFYTCSRVDCFTSPGYSCSAAIMLSDTARCLPLPGAPVPPAAYWYNASRNADSTVNMGADGLSMFNNQRFESPAGVTRFTMPFPSSPETYNTGSQQWPWQMRSAFDGRVAALEDGRLSLYSGAKGHVRAWVSDELLDNTGPTTLAWRESLPPARSFAAPRSARARPPR